jgi:hypothetical protein
LWRYIDFTKFVAMLETRALFFARADKLGDPLECSLTRSEVEERRTFERNLRKRGRPVVLHSLTPDIVRDTVKNTIVSCWHMNEGESMAMWKLYLSSGEGVAIRSTFDRLTSCLRRYNGHYKGYNADNTQKEILIHVGMVQYVDFDSPGPSRHVPRILLQRKSFKHEHEVRAVGFDVSFQGDPGRPTRFPRGGD